MTTPNHPLVSISAATHGVLLELAYATANNVAGRIIYARALCLLHRDAEVCLRRAVVLAAQSGFRLKIFDAFRPQEAQLILWQTAPDRAYVADPQVGSNHTRGTALDLTLVDSTGAELDMGSGFDEMSQLSHHFNTAVSALAQANRQLLLSIMEGAGFVHIAHEWWHYALPEPSRYPLLSSEALGPLNPMHSTH